MKVLIAEDEPISRQILRSTLEKWNYEVVSTANGVEALEAFKKHRFSVVITDWMMPGMDGPELVKHIRDHQGTDYVYIIMLTAKSEKEDLIAGMNSGADDFVAKPFDKDELQVRLRAGERVIQLEEKLSLRNAELQRANENMKMDLEAAAEIQNSLLPVNFPQTQGIHIAWRLRPCEKLAGDILNIFNLDEDHVGLYVLDVSGHGVPAALLAVTLSRLLSPVIDHASLLKFRNDTPSGYGITPPAKVANQLNKRFQVDPRNGQFFTLLYGVLNKKSRRLRYVSAGHPGMIHISPQTGARFLASPSLPIGFMENTQYQENTLNLFAGDRLFLFSDGVPEAENKQKNQFGTERMLHTLQNCSLIPLQESLNALLKALEGWSGQSSLKDDATLLGIEINK